MEQDVIAIRVNELRQQIGLVNPIRRYRRAVRRLLLLFTLGDLFKNSSAWKVGEIELYPVAERWVYLISFDPPLPPECGDCMSMPFKIVVLMDGMAVTASKSRWNPPAPSQR